jgi:acetyltransferase-like isoleucine patch superfamily enzyme
MRLHKIVNPFAVYYFVKTRVIINKFRKVGSNFSFDPKSRIVTPQLIEIGDNVFIGEAAHISAELTIGNNVMFGPRPVILGGDHIFAVKGRSMRFLHPKHGENSSPIFIDDEVWCGACVIILKGVKIGMGSVIGSGSVVAKEIPPYVVSVGNPCRPIKRIFDDEILVNHLITLGKEEKEAIRIKEQRNKMLQEFHLDSLPIIDNTDGYWEFKK